MVFSSSIFLSIFLPVFLVVYYLLPRVLKNIWILIASILFYAWGQPKFIFVILATTTLDFFLVQWLGKSDDAKLRKKLLIASILINTSLLFVFKYLGFFVENINIGLGALGVSKIYWEKLIMPAGISFYTFETLTYVVDVYRGVHKPLKHFWNYQLYILFFPKLIAGPIVRYYDIADQITGRVFNGTDSGRITGFVRFVLGLSKKVLIANPNGQIADTFMAMNASSLSTPTAWIGAVAYTLQIYFDFSGYSDMAIGIAQMIGFKIPENFNNPYTSTSITDFWRRWHITLGAWMRNYLYIPLGGNQVSSKYRLYFNLWIVFIISGFWHGASWTFLLWGAYHGIFLVWERLIGLKLLAKIGTIPSVLITFIIVVIGWVPFRIDNLEHSFKYLKQMFSLDFRKPIPYLDGEDVLSIILGLMLSFFVLYPGGRYIQNKIYQAGDLKTFPLIIVCLIVIGLFFLNLSFVVSSSFNPFIYFRF